MGGSSMISRFLRTNRHLLYGDPDRDSVNYGFKHRNYHVCKKFDECATSAWIATTEKQQPVTLNSKMPDVVQKQTQTETQPVPLDHERPCDQASVKSSPDMFRTSSMPKKSLMESCESISLSNEPSSSVQRSLLKELPPSISASNERVRRLVKTIEVIKMMRYEFLPENNDAPDFRGRKTRFYSGKRPGLTRTIVIGGQ